MQICCWNVSILDWNSVQLDHTDRVAVCRDVKTEHGGLCLLSMHLRYYIPGKIKTISSPLSLMHALGEEGGGIVVGKLCVGPFRPVHASGVTLPI